MSNRRNCIRFIRLFRRNRLQYSPKCFGRIMMINPTDLAKLNKIPDKRSRFLKRMIELPLVGTLLYHTLTGRSNIELLFTESYYHNPFHRSPEDVDAFYGQPHLQSSAGKYLFASLAGNCMNLNIGHALKHIDNSIFLIGGGGGAGHSQKPLRCTQRSTPPSKPRSYRKQSTCRRWRHRGHS